MKKETAIGTNWPAIVQREPLTTLVVIPAVDLVSGGASASVGSGVTDRSVTEMRKAKKCLCAYVFNVAKKRGRSDKQ